jgi:hypothetical protein
MEKQMCFRCTVSVKLRAKSDELKTADAVFFTLSDLSTAASCLAQVIGI